MLKVNFFSKYSSLLSINSLYVCVISGILLCFHYEPFYNQFQSTQEITYLIPFGWFVRYIHFISAQMCIITALFHSFEHLLTYKIPKGYNVLFLNFVVVLLFICSFTGFVLKYDQEGKSALDISMTLVEQIPFLGGFLFSLIFGTANKLNYFYVYHCIVIPVFIFLLLKRHMDLVPSLSLGSISLIVAVTLLYYRFFRVIHDVPHGVIVKQVYAPWFFWGIQFLLKYIHPMIAGVVIPAKIVLVWLCLPLLPRIVSRVFFSLLLCYFLVGILFRLGMI